jgi:hypothetical protein
LTADLSRAAHRRRPAASCSTEREPAGATPKAVTRPNDATMPPTTNQFRRNSYPPNRAINDIPDFSIETMPKAEATQLIPDRYDASHAGFGGYLDRAVVDIVSWRGAVALF